MPDDLLEAMTERCGTCYGTDQVAWCAAWGAWLCADCRSVRSEAETRVTLAEKDAMRAAAEEAA